MRKQKGKKILVAVFIVFFIYSGTIQHHSIDIFAIINMTKDTVSVSV